jgi:hypothetical protein
MAMRFVPSTSAAARLAKRLLGVMTVLGLISTFAATRPDPTGHAGWTKSRSALSHEYARAGRAGGR